MSKISTYLILIIFAFSVVSCVLDKTSEDSDIINNQSNEDMCVLDVIISNGKSLTKAADPNVINSSEYAIEKVRLYVFNKVGTEYKFEKTELFTGSKILAKTETGCKVKIIVKSGIDKKVIAIINESNDKTSELNSLNNISTIQGVKFNFSSYEPADLSYTANAFGHSKGIFGIFNKGMATYKLPAYGESSLFNVNESKTNTISLTVKRSIARFDIYFKRENSNVSYSIAPYTTTSYNGGTYYVWPSIKLSNYVSSGCFSPKQITVNSNEYTIRQTSVKSSDNKSFSLGDAFTRVCYFYMPSIDYSTAGTNGKDLSLEIDHVTTNKYGNTINNYVISVPQFMKLSNIRNIKQNTVYKVYCTIKGLNISVKVVESPWINNNMEGWVDEIVEGETY